MPVNPRDTDFIGYMQSRRKRTKYLTDYLADIFIWISRTTISHTVWLFTKIVSTLLRLVIWNQEYRSK